MGKLSFKGDKPIKKKRKSKASTSAREASEEAEEGWIPVPTSSLAFGPLYLTQRSTTLTPTLCLSLQPTTGKIFPFPLPSSSTLISDLDPEELEAIVENDDPASLGPQDVHHVWVCTRIQDTEDRVTFRSATGKYLAADEVGIVTAAREARGMQEEWTLEDSELAGSIVVKSAYGKYLSVDLVAGGKLELRADEEKEGDNERWSCWMQGEFLLKAKRAKVDRSGIQAERKVDGLVIVGSMAGAENEYIQKYQARGQGRLVSSVEDVRELKRARTEGNLGEKLLDRRAKLKSDRYC